MNFTPIAVLVMFVVFSLRFAAAAKPSKTEPRCMSFGLVGAGFLEPCLAPK